MYRIVDLFAGAGGMSLGFTKQGQFQIAAVVENNINAVKTFKRNHPSENIVYEDDIVGLDLDDFKRRIGEISVVIGGPPCQGFSNANRQRKTLINGNNLLVKRYAEAIKIINPPIFVMENVSMLQSSTHKFFVTNEDNGNISSLGIFPIQETITLYNHNPDGPEMIDLLNNDVAVSDLLFDDGKFDSFKLITRYYNKDKLTEYFKENSKNIVEYLGRYKIESAGEAIGALIGGFIKKASVVFCEKVVSDEGKEAIEKIIEFQKTLRLIQELRNNNIAFTTLQQEGERIITTVQAYPIYTYLEKYFEDLGYKLFPNIMNAVEYGVAQERKRFVLVGVKKDLLKDKTFEIHKETFDRKTVFDAIGDLYDIEPAYEMSKEYIINDNFIADEKALNNSREIYNHISTNTTESSLEMFRALKQGQNFHNLPDELKKTYSKKERTQNTIYLRIIEKEPSGTVVNVRKSMWIHPIKDRAISIREAARLQSFPDSYVFCGTKDSQYQQIGNAVPPLLAMAIAKGIANLLI